MLKSIAKAVFGDANERELKRHRDVIEQINTLESEIKQGDILVAKAMGTFSIFKEKKEKESLAPA